MGAPEATTALNKLIQAATALEVVLGEHRPTSSQAKEPKRPYVRLIYQQMGGPTHIPGRKRGLLAIYCFGTTGTEAWYHATALTEALGLGAALEQRSPDPALDGYALESAWQRLPDPIGGGLVFTTLSFTYYG
ncbi:hypothetical protein D3C72_721610 [compost metagenome]